MGLSRRSFLAAVMGAIAAPTVGKEIDRFSALANNQFQPPFDLFRHYMVWDSVVVKPGVVLNERLFPPPSCPVDFLVSALGVYINSDAPIGSACEVYRAVRLRLCDGARDLLTGPLSLFPTNGAAAPFVQGYHFEAGSDLGLYLESGVPVPSSERITVTVIVQGMIHFSGVPSPAGTPLF